MFNITKKAVMKLMGAAVGGIGALTAHSWLTGDYGAFILSPFHNVECHFATSICFLFTGLIVYTMGRTTYHTPESESFKPHLVVSAASLWLFFLVFNLTIAQMTDAKFALEQVFRVHPYPQIYAHGAGPGIPSVSTLFGFFLVAVAGFIHVFNTGRKYIRLKVIGTTIGIVGTTALLGHIVDYPPLFHYIEGRSSGMSATAAVAFILTSISLVIKGCKPTTHA